MKEKLQAIYNKFFLTVLCLYPAAMLAGLFDYRFRNYFWKWLDAFRPLHPYYMFDFWSALDFYFLAIFALYAIGAIFFRANLPHKQNRAIYAPILLMLIGMIASRIYFEPISPQIKSFWWQVFPNYINPIVAALIFIYSFREKKWTQALQKSLIITFSLFGAIALFQFFTQALQGANKDFLNRLVWPYIDPFYGMKPESANWMAYLFGPIAILSFIRFFQRFNITDLLGFLICGAALLLTRSYTGIVLTVLIISVFTFINIQKKWRLKFCLIVLLILVVAVASQINTRKFQILLGNYKKENSIERRIQIYTLTAKAFVQNPVLGLGPNNYQSYFRKNMSSLIGKPIPEEEIPPHPHNLLAFFWSELGIFGLIGMALIYVLAFHKIISAPKKNYLYFVLLYFLGHGLVDVPYGLAETSALFWFIMALAEMKLYKTEKNA